jgi:hypothetical protein
VGQYKFAPVPTTADELTAQWAERDSQYARRRPGLTGEEAEAVRHMRKAEAAMLVNPFERARMWGRANTWVAPVHTDFGSIKDWLDD